MLSVSDEGSVQEMYDKCADWYNDMMDEEIKTSSMYTTTLSHLHDEICDISGPLVDTSCGTGHMLYMYHEKYNNKRALIGIDLSSRMVEISSKRFLDAPKNICSIKQGDMQNLSSLSSNSCCGVLNYFSLHHLDATAAQASFCEWHRILSRGGQLSVALWEGQGAIDYGGKESIVALSYRKEEVVAWATGAGFTVTKCSVETIEDMGMDAVYLCAVKATE